MSDTRLSGQCLKGVMALIDTVIQIAFLIPLDDARGLVNAINYADTIGPIIDPTGYRDHMAQGHVNLEMARAFLTFRKEIERIREQAMKNNRRG